MFSKRAVEKLRNHRTPFYLYDLDLLRRTLGLINEACRKYGYRMHYSMKANSDPRVMQCVKEAGMGIDCVSGNEVVYAVEMGFDPAEIVFAGVGKRDEEIVYGIEHGILAFNCESKHEVEIINQIAGEMGRRVNIALRINPDIDSKTEEHITTGKADCKFGISRRELAELFDELPELNNVNIMGLHFHVGSQITDMSVFELLCQEVNKLYGWFVERGLRIESLDLGGGLGVNYDDPDGCPLPDVESYFDVFARNLVIEPCTVVRFELGRAVVAQCGELISRVLFLKVNESGRRVAVIDASMTELIRPAMYNARHALENLDGDGRERDVFTVVGTVCESSDNFAVSEAFPEFRRGDLVSIKTAGAYGASMSSTYNMHPLPQAVYSDDLQSSGI